MRCKLVNYYQLIINKLYNNLSITLPVPMVSLKQVVPHSAETSWVEGHHSKWLWKLSSMTALYETCHDNTTIRTENFEYAHWKNPTMLSHYWTLWCDSLASRAVRHWSQFWFKHPFANITGFIIGAYKKERRCDNPCNNTRNWTVFLLIYTH